MNNVTLAHIGGDLVLIGGVAFYFHRKTMALQEDITTLKKEHKELTDAIEELQENMQRLAAMVIQQNPRGLHPQPRPQPQPQPQPQQQPQPQPQLQPQQPQQQQQPQPQPQLQPQRETFMQPDPMQLQGMMDMMQGLMPGMHPDMTQMAATTGPQPAVTLGGHKKVRKPKSDSEDSGDETYDDHDLDQELAGEYQQLTQERQDTTNCIGETCKLMD